MEIYLKQKEKITKTKHTNVTVKDLCDIVSEDNKVKDVVVYRLPKNEYKRYIISSIEITKSILNYNKDISINYMGVTDTVVEYKEDKEKNEVLEKLKVIILCIVVFAGASTAIMSFHNETQIPKVFEEYYIMFFGKELTNTLMIDIPYSIGITIGIIIFFNHVFGKKITDSPTPIEVELAKYESDLAITEVKIEQHKTRRENENGTS